jgi:hypothetical protein
MSKRVLHLSFVEEQPDYHKILMEAGLLRIMTKQEEEELDRTYQGYDIDQEKQEMRKTTREMRRNIRQEKRQ